MIGCCLAEIWRWRDEMCGQGQEDLETVSDDMKLLSLHPERAIFSDKWKDLIWGKHLTLT